MRDDNIVRLTTKIEFEACRSIRTDPLEQIIRANPFEQIHSNLQPRTVITSGSQNNLKLWRFSVAGPLIKQIHSTSYNWARRRRRKKQVVRADSFEQIRSSKSIRQIINEPAAGAEKKHNCFEQIHSSRSLQQIIIEPAAGAEKIQLSSRSVRADPFEQVHSSRSIRADPFEQIHSIRSIRQFIITFFRANPFEQIHSSRSIRADPFEQIHSNYYNYNFYNYYNYNFRAPIIIIIPRFVSDSGHFAQLQDIFWQSPNSI
jgi:hypothetical protein